MSFRNLWDVIREAVLGWVRDKAGSMGAALAYYTLFSIVPLLLLLIALAGLFFGADAAQGAVVEQLTGLMGRESAETIETMLRQADRPGGGLAATIISVFTLLVGATTVLAELQSDLDRIFRAPASARPRGLWGLLRTRLLSLGMILGIAFLLVVSLAASAGLAALHRWWSRSLGEWLTVLQIFTFAFDLAVITGVIAMIYRFMPSVHLRWHDVWRGAALTALLLAAGKFLIGLYIGGTDIASGFGAAGSLIILLIWVYYSTQIFLLGAEFTAVFARRYGSHAGQKGGRE